jgi:alkylation response protein AidB-like acyl-CoA dehydrogenase
MPAPQRNVVYSSVQISVWQSGNRTRFPSLGFASVYYGLAQCALDWTIENVKKKTSVGMSRSMAYHAEVQHAVAEMVIEMESISPHLDEVVQDWSDVVDYGHGWGSKIVAAKYRVVEGGWRIVDTVMELAGGFGIFKVAGASVPRRTARPHSPGQRVLDARIRGQNGARHQPG